MVPFTKACWSYVEETGYPPQLGIHGDLSLKKLDQL